MPQESLRRLLDLQTEDTALRRLQDRRASLPEAKQLAGVNDSLAELAADIEIATKQHDEVAREQSKLEGEIALAEQKIAREEQRLFSGAVSNPKELGALQAEVAMLKRQRVGLEDTLLEIMVQKDQAAATLERLLTEQQQAASESETLTATVGALTTEISTELDEYFAAHSGIASEIPSEILELYEKIRASKGGIGAAALEDGTCRGCHTRLPNKEIERIKAEGGLQRCDNCRRILVVQ